MLTILPLVNSRNDSHRLDDRDDSKKRNVAVFQDHGRAVKVVLGRNGVQEEIKISKFFYALLVEA